MENDREDRSESLIELIQSYGYRLYWHTPPLYREENFFGNRENVFPGIVSVNMLAVHPSCGIEIHDLRTVAGPRSRWSDLNDRRAALKRQVNELLGSRLTEEKSYAPY